MIYTWKGWTLIVFILALFVWIMGLFPDLVSMMALFGLIWILFYSDYELIIDFRKRDNKLKGKSNDRGN